jgi:integrase/recombinase XerD
MTDSITDALIDNFLNTFPNLKTRTAYAQDLSVLVQACPGLPCATFDEVVAIAKRITAEGNTNTQSRRLSALRSFFKYLQEAGHREDNPARSVRLPKAKEDLAERILTETEYHQVLAKEENPRNALLIELLYATGGRISEALAAKWKDAQVREQGGQIVYFGKREKTRTVLIPPGLWEKLIVTRTGDDDYIFPSPKDPSKHLSASQAWRIVQNAGLRAIGKRISPHWFRHAHASHAIDRGAPVSLVQQTLGHADLRTTSRYVHARPNDSSSLYLPVK